MNKTKTPSPAEPLTVEEIAALREIISWYRDLPAEESEPEPPKYRPAFPGPRDNTGIRINRKLHRGALAKAKVEGADVTGGGKLSALIEFLFWKYLNFDPKYCDSRQCD